MKDTSCLNKYYYFFTPEIKFITYYIYISTSDDHYVFTYRSVGLGEKFLKDIF